MKLDKQEFSVLRLSRIFTFLYPLPRFFVRRREEKKTKKQTKKDNNKKNDETIVDEVSKLPIR